MRALIPLAALALVLGCSLPETATARDAGDLAEEDFRSQKPPDYAALERLQRANLGLPAGTSQPPAPSHHRARGRRRR